MSTHGYIRTTALVLRMTPYSESSLIAAALTPDHGQVHLMLKGARQTGKRRFPAADLFRRLDVVYRPSASSDLHTCHELSATGYHDAVARSPRHYAVAVWLARLAITNTVEGVAMPEVYAALDLALDRLSLHPAGPLEPIALAVCLTLLSEHGVLPDLDHDPRRGDAMLQMLAYAQDPDATPPEYDADAWGRLISWVRTYMERQSMKQPPAWPTAGYTPPESTSASRPYPEPDTAPPADQPS